LIELKKNLTKQEFYYGVYKSVIFGRREEEDIGHVLRLSHSLREFVLVGYTQFIKHRIIIKAFCPLIELFTSGTKKCTMYVPVI
jgi:hypothetical protein